jgi:hypothetical protein
MFCRGARPPDTETTKNGVLRQWPPRAPKAFRAQENPGHPARLKPRDSGAMAGAPMRLSGHDFAVVGAPYALP